MTGRLNQDGFRAGILFWRVRLVAVEGAGGLPAAGLAECAGEAAPGGRGGKGLLLHPLCACVCVRAT